MEERRTTEIWLLASGDSRLAANQTCWATQAAMEKELEACVDAMGYRLRRAHAYDPQKGHGFIDSQKMGIEVFRSIPETVPLIVAESVWQYSHHVYPGLISHKGPLLTLANWSGKWPGLVGMLNLNGSLTKAEVPYSTLWSEDFKDEFFLTSFRHWLTYGIIEHDVSHVRPFDSSLLPSQELKIGETFAREFVKKKAIIGVFDEGCMGMFNAIVPDSLLHPLGIFKERLSQSALYARMQGISREEAEEVLNWLLARGFSFNWGKDEATELTKEQSLAQAQMYIAAVRMADEFGCASIGIQYQQGLQDTTVASDLVEGLLNNRERPPVYAADGRELYAGEALPHFNEVDECAGIDGLVTYALWKELGMSGENTLHDVRWGEQYEDEQHAGFVWVFQISGAVPAAHIQDGYRGAQSDRQPPMYFRLGGGTLKGVGKPGPLVWSRIYIEKGALHCDMGVGEALQLPEKETRRRWAMTTPEWPIVHARLFGVSRDQFMGKHKANHIQIVYADSPEQAESACRIKAAALQAMGIQVNFCGGFSKEENER